MGNVVVGTCSWADKTMIERWYPKSASTAEARLRYYADRFSTVEVDSTFYALPARSTVEAWAARTPPGFVFHVKAYGLLTGHEVDERTLHPELRDSGFDFAVTSRGRVRNPDAAMTERAFDLFVRAVEPLVASGRMGGVLMQYPPWFTAVDREHREQNLAHIAEAQALLDPLPLLVEFRHASWGADHNFNRAAKFLADRGMTFVCVDAPQVGAGAMPPVCAATASIGYVRLHGRNREMWGAHTASAADRFDYLYSHEELAEWVAPVRELAAETERTYVMFNNCKYDYAPRNAAEMAEILGDLVAPSAVGDAEAGEPGQLSLEF